MQASIEEQLKELSNPIEKFHTVPTSLQYLLELPWEKEALEEAWESLETIPVVECHPGSSCHSG
jgi:3-polyprenyl-4-hydroxybenzoate decarboxylase